MTKHSVPSIATFAAFVQLKDYRLPTKKEYVRYVRRLGDHYQCDPATLAEDQVRAYYLELRQIRKFGASAMRVAKCAFRCFFREHLKLGLTWTVFEDLRIAPPQTLPLVLAREQVAALLQAVQQPRYRTLLGLIYHTGLRVGEAVRVELRDLRDSHSEHPRLHEAALKYLAAYLCRPPLHESQIEHWDPKSVTFRYRDNGGTLHRDTVTGSEFVRRCLQHVLPKGFQRVRHYGWRGAAAKAKWERILALLDWRVPAPQLSALNP